MISALQLVLMLIFPVMAVVGALRDLTSFTIPNWISAGPGRRLRPGRPGLRPGARRHRRALRRLRRGPSGRYGHVRPELDRGRDAKLFAAAALWLGLPASLSYLLVTAVAGGALTLGLLSLRSPLLRPYVLSGPPWFGRLAEPEESIPYGVAIAAGALIAFPASPLMQAWGV
jgi:prepilin peptidase CpaA